ncbi:MAG: hypothetical protein WC120_01915 [Parcubacteria group bacterium]
MENICKIHNIAMEEVLLKTQWGLIRFTQEYRKAREELFPNSGDSKLGGCMLDRKTPENEKVSVYVCPKCKALKKDWLRQPGNRMHSHDRYSNMDDIKRSYAQLRETPFPAYGKMVEDFVSYGSLLAGYADRFSQEEFIDYSEIPAPDRNTWLLIRQLLNKKELQADEREFLRYFNLLEKIRQALQECDN